MPPSSRTKGATHEASHVVWGFASTVGTTVATGKAITTVGIQNPALVAAAALVTGAVFGIVSETFGEALSHKPQPQLN
jgi:hypothetical protein